MSVPAFSDIAKSANDVRAIPSSMEAPFRAGGAAFLGSSRLRRRPPFADNALPSSSTRISTTSRPALSRSRATRPTMSPSRSRARAATTTSPAARYVPEAPMRHRRTCRTTRLTSCLRPPRSRENTPTSPMVRPCAPHRTRDTHPASHGLLRWEMCLHGC